MLLSTRACVKMPSACATYMHIHKYISIYIVLYREHCCMRPPAPPIYIHTNIYQYT